MKQSERELRLQVSVAQQKLNVRRGRQTLRSFPISTSRYGLGSEEGSCKTPTGKFRVAEMIGAGLPPGIAFRSRQPVKPTRKMLEADDLVMSRILWLDGLEKSNANTHDRYIYIHGTNHEDEIGRPASHGCIRMRNADVAELFEMVKSGTPVSIAAPRPRAARKKKGAKNVARRKRRA